MIWKIKYPAYKELSNSLFFPSIIGVDMKYFLSGDDEGNIYFWKNKKELVRNCGGVLKGHNSMISDLEVNKKQT